MARNPRPLVLPSRGQIFLRDLFWLTVVVAAAFLGYAWGSFAGAAYLTAPKMPRHFQTMPQPGVRDTSLAPQIQEALPG